MFNFITGQALCGPFFLVGAHKEHEPMWTMRVKQKRTMRQGETLFSGKLIQLLGKLR